MAEWVAVLQRGDARVSATETEGVEGDADREERDDRSESVGDEGGAVSSES